MWSGIWASTTWQHLLRASTGYGMIHLASWPMTGGWLNADWSLDPRKYWHGSLPEVGRRCPVKAALLCMTERSRRR